MYRIHQRYLSLSLALLLAVASSACAQGTDIAQLQSQAAQGWHQTYEAGGRTVAVDIPIQVPDTDQYPVLEATYMPLLQQPVVSDWADATLFQDSQDFFRLDSCSPRAMQQAGSAAQKNTPRGMDVQPIYLEINQLDTDTAYAYNNPATVRDAQTMMDTVWADNHPEYPAVLTPYAVYATGEMRHYSEDAAAFTGDPWPYQGVLMVYFHQVIDNIPILTNEGNCFVHLSASPVKARAILAGGTAILQKMPDDTAMFYSAQYTLYDVQKTLLADLPLCGLDPVIKTCEQLIHQGLLRQVSSLELGYVAWQTADNRFTLVPVWALTGDLYPDADTATTPLRRNADPRTQEHGILLINAQTGAPIDPAATDVSGLYE